MRLVLDSNVLIAGFIARGLCHDLFQYTVEFHEVQISPFIVNEVVDCLRHKIRMPQTLVRSHRRFLTNRLTLSTPPNLAEAVCRDPDDDAILALALHTKSSVIVSGDKDLLDLREFAQIPIVNPRDFWLKYR